MTHLNKKPLDFLIILWYNNIRKRDTKEVDNADNHNGSSSRNSGNRDKRGHKLADRSLYFSLAKKL